MPSATTPKPPARPGSRSTGSAPAVYIVSGACAGLAGFIVIAQIGRLDAGFGEGREFDVIAAAVLGGASLFGGVGSALGALVGATLIQTVKSGLVFTGVNLYLQPILMAAIIFLAVLIDYPPRPRACACRSAAPSAPSNPGQCVIRTPAEWFGPVAPRDPALTFNPGRFFIWPLYGRFPYAFHTVQVAVNTSRHKS